MTSITRRIITAYALLHTSAASLYPLQDARPYLASGEANPIEWSAGGPAFVTASAGALRLNFRGAHLYPPSTRMRTLDRLTEWTGVPCNASAWALCAADVSRFMPSSPALPRMPEAPEALDSKWAQLGCTDSRGKVLVSQGVYDISACDILDQGVDAVYSAGMLYHARTAMPLWRYWACVALAIVLVRTLSYNIQILWTPSKKQAQKQGPALAASLLLLGLVLVDLDHMYITKADQLYFWCSVAYAAFYIVLHSGTRMRALLETHSHAELGNKRVKTRKEHELPVFNVIAAALQILATRLYTAAETPYNPLLTGMIACRVWTKVIAIHSGKRDAGHHKMTLSLLVDSIYLSLNTEIANDGPRELLVAVIAVAHGLAQLLVSAY